MKRQVIIEVSGGVAYVAGAPDDIEVIIKDYDNQDTDESYTATPVSGTDSRVDNFIEYEKYFDECERANKHPLHYEAWLIKYKVS